MNWNDIGWWATAGLLVGVLGFAIYCAAADAYYARKARIENQPDGQ